MYSEINTDKYCPCCKTEMITIVYSDKEKELQCFNCGYTKSIYEA